jgi:hypothetical protein
VGAEKDVNEHDFLGVLQFIRVKKEAYKILELSKIYRVFQS